MEQFTTEIIENTELLMLYFDNIRVIRGLDT